MSSWWMEWYQPKSRLWVASANKDHFPFQVVYSDMGFHLVLDRVLGQLQLA